MHRRQSLQERPLSFLYPLLYPVGTTLTASKSLSLTVCTSFNSIFIIFSSTLLRPFLLPSANSTSQKLDLLFLTPFRAVHLLLSLLTNHLRRAFSHQMILKHSNPLKAKSILALLVFSLSISKASALLTHIKYLSSPYLNIKAVK